MKATKLIPALIFTLLAAISHASEQPDVLLRGILNLGNNQAFSLSNTAGTESAWLKVGQSFNGYSLKSFNAENETLTIATDSSEFELSLTAATENSAGSSEERLAEASRMMNLMNFEKMMDDTMDAQMDAMSKMMRQQMAQIGQSVDEEFIEFQSQAVREMFEEIDWAPIKEGMTEVYAEVFTKAELEGMSNFYTTPSGQASIEKMPEVQSKTMEVMMPAIMQASQNMQKKMMQFMQERQKQAAE